MIESLIFKNGDMHFFSYQNMKIKILKSMLS